MRFLPVFTLSESSRLPVGHRLFLKDAMEFAQAKGIRSKTVVFDGIDKAPEAYTAMRQGEFRVVIKIADE